MVMIDIDLVPVTATLLTEDGRPAPGVPPLPVVPTPEEIKAEKISLRWTVPSPMVLRGMSLNYDRQCWVRQDFQHTVTLAGGEDLTVEINVMDGLMDRLVDKLRWDL